MWDVAVAGEDCVRVLGPGPEANEVLEDYSQVETGAAATFVGVYDGHGGAEASRFISNHLSAHLANEVLEDYSQVETGAAATFVGVYDGHGGAEASRFISNHLSAHLVRLAQESGAVSENVVRNAFSATEEGFLSLVRRTHLIKPSIAAIGSCCLVGVIWRKTLYLANLGDSRAVVGCLVGSNKIVAEQLTRDHNASIEEVRQELKSLHPDDSQIVVLKNGVWRIKGIIQGIARRLIKAALKEAARKREMRYNDITKLEKGEGNASAPELSVRGFVESGGSSSFSGLNSIS
ncbi:putative protein phosphatase 2C 43 [Triticum urartu]|uniref:protein-serine/threonine phosphatase n=1 Tax=Triticum urartu TaxID=4572 RepID=M7YZH8_TRIUA|nr:putative protein phosphatase 2C 43 [Triticum urartu]